MIPTEFIGFNVTFDKDQPEYLPLPVHIDKENGIVTSCWKLNVKERLKVLFTGRLYLRTMTFNKPLQPLLPSVNNPIILK